MTQLFWSVVVGSRVWLALGGASMVGILVASALVHGGYDPRPAIEAKLEGAAPSASPGVAAIPGALARKDFNTAEKFWLDAYRTALASRRWDSLIEVGDAWLRMAHAADVPQRAEPAARRMYMKALFAAREQGSLEGVIRAAEAFHALGDRQVVAEALRIAEMLARSADEAGRARFIHLQDLVVARSAGADWGAERF